MGVFCKYGYTDITTFRDPCYLPEPFHTPRLNIKSFVKHQLKLNSFYRQGSLSKSSSSYIISYHKHQYEELGISEWSQNVRMSYNPVLMYYMFQSNFKVKSCKKSPETLKQRNCWFFYLNWAPDLKNPPKSMFTRVAET